MDGKEWDLFRPIEHDAKTSHRHSEDPEALELIRHDTAHVPRDGGCRRSIRALRSPSVRRSTTASITTSRAASPSRRRPAQDRRGDAQDHQGGFADRREVWPRDQAIAHFERHRRALQGRTHQEHSGERGCLDLLAWRLARPVPRPAFRDHRQDRRRVQADQDFPAPIGAAMRRTRSSSASTAPHGATRRNWTITSCVSRSKRSATTARSAATWSSSPFRPMSARDCAVDAQRHGHPPGAGVPRRHRGAQGRLQARLDSRDHQGKTSTSVRGTSPITARTCTRRSISRARIITSSR